MHYELIVNVEGHSLIDHFHHEVFQRLHLSKMKIFQNKIYSLIIHLHFLILLIMFLLYFVQYFQFLSIDFPGNETMRSFKK